jgi:hypothetical protein
MQSLGVSDEQLARLITQTEREVKMWSRMRKYPPPEVVEGPVLWEVDETISGRRGDNNL